MKSKGLVDPQCFSFPRETRSRSATNSMYWHIRVQFIYRKESKETESATRTKIGLEGKGKAKLTPMRETGRASLRNSCSMATASLMMERMISG